MDQIYDEYKRLVLGVDPGLISGWSLLSNEDGYQYASGQLDLDEVPEWLQSHMELPIEMIVIEDFRLFAHKAKAQIGSRFETCKVIGMFEFYAHLRKTPVTLQSPSIKVLAQKFSGVKPPSNHDESHHVDAFNHAVFWLTQQGRYTTRLQRELSLRTR